MRRSTADPRALLIALAVSGLAGCGEADGGDAATTFTDSAGIAIALSDPARAPACTLSSEPRTAIGVASGDPDHELYRVFGARRLSTGEVAVANQGSRQVRVYDAAGRFVRAFGREGGGPGEFRSMFLLWRLPGDTLWVGDYRPWRYQVYTADGEWVRTVRPEPAWPNPPGGGGVLSDGRLILAERPPIMNADRTFPGTELVLMTYGPDGALADTLGRYPAGRRGRVSDDRASLVLFPFFESGTELAAAGRRLYLGHEATSSVSVHEMTESAGARAPAGETSPLPPPSLIIRWRTGDRTVTAADIEAEKGRLREQYADVDPGLRQRLVDPLVSDDRPAADVFPAFITLTPGTDGSLWVTEYPDPGGDGGRTHLVFHDDGALRCRVASPPGFTRYEAGADYVLGHHRDDVGVERVLLYGFGEARTESGAAP